MMNESEDNTAVKIAVRECPSRSLIEDDDATNTIRYHNPKIILVDERPFTFDYVLPANTTQKEVFDLLIEPLVEKTLKGFRCTALAYGQTGTGKSFTMGLNPETLEGANIGVIPRCLEAVLNLENTRQNSEVKREISTSFIEIYNEKVYDLLSENPNEAIIAKGHKFTGGIKKLVGTIEDGNAILQNGTKNRHVRPTKMNPKSSRSHAIFTIHVKSEYPDSIVRSSLNLVDLAGSEGVRRTGHQGVALSEGVNINQGLLSIGKVLQAIANSYRVIPYRDSVLTTMLRDSLNSNSYFTLLACISPYRQDLSETLSSLRFSQNAKRLNNNPDIQMELLEIKRTKPPEKIARYSRKSSLFMLRSTKGIMSTQVKKNVARRPLGHTFCTPTKIKPTNNTLFNRTIAGITPKHKQTLQSVQMFSERIPPLDGPVENPSYDSIKSDLSQNISTSTEVDAPQPGTGTSLTPIVRKCMVDMENVMKNYMLKAFQSIKQSNKHQKRLFKSTIISIDNSLENNLSGIIPQEIKILSKNRNHEKYPTGIHQVESFKASSPILRPENRLSPQSVFQPPLHLSAITAEDNCFKEGPSNAKPVRKSRRLSVKNMLIHSNREDTQPLRRSTRLSILHTEKNKKRGLFCCGETIAEVPEHLIGPKTQSHVNKKNNVTKKDKKALVSNSIINGYFEEQKGKRPKKPESALQQHRKAILEMLNSASLKELQYLPQVGIKTAFQIFTQRRLHGTFKTWNEVEKLPIWRKGAWERFKQFNNIT